MMNIEMMNDFLYNNDLPKFDIDLFRKWADDREIIKCVFKGVKAYNDEITNKSEKFKLYTRFPITPPRNKNMSVWLDEYDNKIYVYHVSNDLDIKTEIKTWIPSGYRYIITPKSWMAPKAKQMIEIRQSQICIGECFYQNDCPITTECPFGVIKEVTNV